MFRLQARLKHLKVRLHTWNQEVFGNIFEEKQALEDHMELIHNNWIKGDISQNSINTERNLMQKWNEWCHQEEILQRQKSRIKWLKEGDKNTKFFHRSAMDYICNNKITKLKDEQGTSFQSHQEIASILRNHFSLIATEPDIDKREAINEVITLIPKLITEEKNKSLNRLVTLQEVEEAVKEMASGKALGPDGFTVEFFKQIGRAHV